jgi:hypothetical protein
MVGGIIVLALVILVLVSSEEGEAATINVPGDYPTISQAITASNPGDTINVGAGTYNEHLVIDKGLTFSGAGSNVVTIDGEHTINASNVQLDGFTFVNTDDYTIAIHATSGAISNIQVTNSVFDLVGYSGVHIGGDSGSANSISNVAINSNTFNGPPSMASNPFKIGGLFGAPADQPVDNLDFIGNTVFNCSIPVNLNDANINDALIDSNTFRNTDGIIYIWGEGVPVGILSNFVFTNNDVDSSNSYGVGIGYPNGIFSPTNFGTGNRINYNSFDNIPGAYGMGAVSNFMGTTLNATENWWGDPSGPSGAGPGIGSPISTDVDYSPWWRKDYVGDPHATPWKWGTDDSVQDAINTAGSGDILRVNSGIYSEDILVDKNINIFDSSFALQGNVMVSGTGALYLDDASVSLDTLTVQSGGMFRYYNSGTTLYVGEQNIYGTAEWWEARIVTGNIFVHDGGMLYVNSTDVNMNCSFDGEYGIQVNATGTMVTLDNGTGRSEVTAKDNNYYYFFNVYGTLSSSDTDITFGWELYINSANTVSLGNNVLVQHMDNHGIHVSGSPDVWIANSNVNFNTQYGMAVELASSVWVASTTISNNKMGIVVSDSTLSVADSDIQTNSMIGLLGDSSTIALSGNIITNNAAWDVYAIGCTATSEDDDITNMMQVYSDFTIFPGSGLQTISGWWVFHNTTAGNAITVQTDVDVLVGGGLILGNTTFVMDSTSAGWTVALDLYGTFRAQLWDNNPNHIQGANKAQFYFRAQAGSTFNLTDCYLNNVGRESNNLEQTGLWVNTDDFVIQDNIIANNYNGLVFQDITGPVNVVSGNTLSNCGGIAIVVVSSDTLYIESNMISRCMPG